jgi:hypothetical protein
VKVAVDLDVGHHDREHLLVHVNSRDPVWHRTLLVGAESVPSHITQGRELSLALGQAATTLNYSFNHARSGSNSCSASLAPWLISISPLPAAILTNPRFHSLSRASRPSRNQLRKSSSAASQSFQ